MTPPEPHKARQGPQAPGARGGPATRSSDPDKATHQEALEGAVCPVDAFTRPAPEGSSHSGLSARQAAVEGSETMGEWGAQARALARDSAGSA